MQLDFDFMLIKARPILSEPTPGYGFMVNLM